MDAETAEGSWFLNGGQYLASNILTPLNPIVWGEKSCLQNNDSPQDQRRGVRK